MFANLTDRAQALLYIVLVLAATLAVVLLKWYQLMMFVPTIGALVMMLLITRDGYSRAGWRRLGLNRAGVRAWPLAFLIPILCLGGGYLVALAMGVAKYQPLPGMTGLPLVLNYLILVLIYTFTFSLGEELGWRGYLLPRLMAFGRIPAHLIGGLAWALFHYPIIFLTDLYLPEGNRFLNALLFTLMVMALNAVFGEVRLASGSVWVASLLHSTHNALNELVGQGFQVTAPLGNYILGEAGVVTILLYFAMAAWLMRWTRGRRQGVSA